MIVYNSFAFSLMPATSLSPAVIEVKEKTGTQQPNSEPLEEERTIVPFVRGGDVSQLNFVFNAFRTFSGADFPSSAPDVPVRIWKEHFEGRHLSFMQTLSHSLQATWTHPRIVKPMEESYYAPIVRHGGGVSALKYVSKAIHSF